MRDAAALLLEWYDENARTMPWRIGPKARQAGQMPDPYHVWLSEIMLQQTTVAAVKAYFEKFIQTWPTVADLAAANDADVMAAWAGLGYYARARNLLKCARVIAHERQGKFPQDRADLQALPGVGPYTSAAVGSIAFDRPYTVVDGNVERVVARLFAVETPLPPAKAELTALAEQLTPNRRPGDYAQAVMDLGATICTPKSPACGICPLMDMCAARRGGIASELPRKLPKQTKPIRYGIAYVITREDGAVFLERRPQKGLLGGMLGFPGTDWTEGAVPEGQVENVSPVEVRHTFTHFHLRLKVVVGDDPGDMDGQFIPRPNFRPSDLPTIMRKVWDAAQSFSK
ncbi:MAG: A/G-specific adenine glycosylase [Planktomarina sp.]